MYIYIYIYIVAVIDSASLGVCCRMRAYRSGSYGADHDGVSYASEYDSKWALEAAIGGQAEVPRSISSRRGHQERRLHDRIYS